MFLKNGKKIDHIMQIPIQESILIITMIPFFRGTDNITTDPDRIASFNFILKELEHTVIIENEKLGFNYNSEENLNQERGLSSNENS